jgi:hypothetical protein
MLVKEGITWTNFIDGSTDGPISSSWNVHSWPTIYILDEKGVIRHRGLRGKPMEAAVDELLTKRKSEER